MRAVDQGLGRKRVDDIAAWDLVPLIEEITPNGGPARRNRVRAVLHRMFQLAVELDVLDRNPVRFKREKEKCPPWPAFSPKELQSVLQMANESCPLCLYSLILLSLVTSARRRELFRLRDGRRGRARTCS